MAPMSKYKYTLVGIMLIVVVFLIYSNTFQTPWIFDDYHSIKYNEKIQISNFSLENIKGSFFSYQSTPEKLYRPLSCLTFALNALISGQNVFGYHFVNISVHAATSLTLMWLLVLVFKTPAFTKMSEREKNFIIALATILWTVNPIQTQAVTYIVQRMAALCALFSFMSLGFFIKARLAEFWKKKICYIVCCITAFMCAIFSKENGFITFPLILVLEYFLFRKGDYKILLKKEFILAFLIFILLITFYFTYSDIFSNLLKLNEKRSFSLTERLLTQPKILLYYLSLIFYPLPQRLSLEHEIIISTGLFSPPLTFLYLIVCVSSFCVCIFYKRINLLIRIGIVFYFIAHGIESTIIPLEMIFEHRNYLPSAFLFPPVAFYLYRLYDHFRLRKVFMSTIIISFITIIIFMSSLATYSRNFDWSDSETIWYDAMNKAPGNSRPKQSMGYVIGMKNPEKALNYYSMALNGFMHSPKEETASTLANAGLIFFHLQNYERARHFFKLATDKDPKFMLANHFLIETYMKEGKWDKAIQAIDDSLTPTTFKTQKSACLLHTGDYIQSLSLSRENYRSNPDNLYSLLNIAESLSLAGYHNKANLFYNIYVAKKPNDPQVYLRMSKNYYLNRDSEKALKVLTAFFRMTGIEKTKSSIENLISDTQAPLIVDDKMIIFIQNNFEIYKNKFQIR